MLNQYVLGTWIAIAFRSEGPLEVILRLLKALGEILDVLRSL